MSYIVSLEGFIPPPRFDTIAWTSGRIEEGPAADGPWSALLTTPLSPVDADPTNPASRNFTVATAEPTGWYRVVWIDSSANESESAPTFSDQTTYQAGGVNFAALYSRLLAMNGGMTPVEAKARINQAHKRMVAESEFIKARVTIAESVTGQATYELDPDIVQLLSLRVDGRGYDRKAIDELDDLSSSDAWPVGRGSVRFFAPDFSIAGLAEVSVYPVPTSDGLAITGRAIMLPPDLVNDTDYPSLPADYHEDLVDGAQATVLRRDDERLPDADALEQRFVERIRQLRGRQLRRVGSGNARLQIVR